MPSLTTEFRHASHKLCLYVFAEGALKKKFELVCQISSKSINHDLKILKLDRNTKSNKKNLYVKVSGNCIFTEDYPIKYLIIEVDFQQKY